MKKYISMLLILLMVFSLAACSGIEKEHAVKDGSKDENVVVDPAPKINEQEVTLFFVNKKYIETSDKNLEKLISEKRLVKYGDTSLEEAVVRELMKGSDNKELSTEIPSSAKLINVEVADGTAFVNFARDGLYGGSMQEIFTIMQITRTLNALPNIQRVQFLIDGNKSETLMGHIGVSEPFKGPFEMEMDV
ncbi:GerMN domain-containing protein [Lutispora thermophila]|uniref:Sporulation and spore germination n=1 Tax=Lutispora thermophila DSM 19022 TaxID=1122184 RepID=A0A1M6EWC7_9FIRM|nr:GerMN domain-containing protein [Lutispora thermophila]SHI89720.1 Sporulation and spore germination [Lutispora thermophila DSM 19022]